MPKRPNNYEELLKKIQIAEPEPMPKRPNNYKGERVDPRPQEIFQKQEVQEKFPVLSVLEKNLRNPEEQQKQLRRKMKELSKKTKTKTKTKIKTKTKTKTKTKPKLISRPRRRWGRSVNINKGLSTNPRYKNTKCHILRDKSLHYDTRRTNPINTIGPYNSYEYSFQGDNYTTIPITKYTDE